ncbi:MAG: OB-fold domain-containing protein [Casimicrobiaceae bacterium]
MTDGQVPSDGNVAVPLELRLRYDHALGELSPFFRGLEAGRAVATRCGDCGRTWFAPRLVCVCGSRAMHWVELAGLGTIEAITVGRSVLPCADVAATFAFALIRLDGAANACFGRVAMNDSSLGRGDRVRLRRAAGTWPHPVQCAEYAAVESSPVSTSA